MANRRRGTPPKRVGVVISNRMSKTVVVETVTTVRDLRYQKFVRRRNRIKAHDEQGCQVGDRVEIVSTRPLSKTKHWCVRRVVEKSKRQG